MDKTNIKIKTRFAPSPTGVMHFGNTRTALFNYLFAKKHQGEFILRIEDTDKARSTANYLTAILEDLKAIGLVWDGVICKQSERSAVYEQFYQQLIDKNLMYPCFCSEEKLVLMRKLQLSKGLPPRYDGTCLNLTKHQVIAKLENKATCSYRFKIPKDLIIEFNDLIKGPQKFNSNDFGDFIIKRQDNTAPFMFCNVIDDVMQGITHVLRGEDHLSNTPRQLLILKMLNLNEPHYAHFPLIKGIDGLKLSKRGGSKSVKELLQVGYLSEALVNYLARLGHNYALDDNILNKLLNLEQLAYSFDLKNISSHAASHDLNHLKFWQKQAMVAISGEKLLNILFYDLKDLKTKELLNNIENNKLINFLSLIKANILLTEEAIMWANIIFNEKPEYLDNKEVLEINPDFLNVVFNNLDNYADLCNQLKQAGFTGKNLFLNLRMLLTGQNRGPELKNIFELIGADNIKKRINYILNK